MMRLLRTASLLLVAFYLPTSAVTASAACGWLLWSHGGTSTYGWTYGGTRTPATSSVAWKIEEAFDAKGACQQEVERIHENYKGFPPHPKGKLPTREIVGGYVVERSFDDDGRMTSAYSVRLLCLPSDFDPRRGEEKK